MRKRILRKKIVLFSDESNCSGRIAAYVLRIIVPEVIIVILII